ncbi:hypothetical protein [Streptomyces sp. HUAS TT7]|uniref:hypothetical protein n=1 Tax=Streptomyces sp. HUAS TT7 TaxID=3447507 RepID=UPI003F660082
MTVVRDSRGVSRGVGGVAGWAVLPEQPADGWAVLPAPVVESAAALEPAPVPAPVPVPPVDDLVALAAALNGVPGDGCQDENHDGCCVAVYVDRRAEFGALA